VASKRQSNPIPQDHSEVLPENASSSPAMQRSSAGCIDLGSLDQILRWTRRLSTALSRHNEMLPLLNDVLQHIAEICGCSIMKICILDGKGRICFQAESGSPGSSRITAACEGCAENACPAQSWEGSEDSQLQPSLTSGGSFYSNHASVLAPMFRNLEFGKTPLLIDDPRCESIAWIPIRCDGRNVGFIQLQDDRQGMISSTVVQCLEWVALQLGLTIEWINSEKLLRSECRDLQSGLLVQAAELSSARRELQLERDKIKTLFANMEEGVHVIDQDHKILYANPSLIKTFGLINDRRCYEYYHNRRDPCPWCRNREVFAGAPVRGEWHSDTHGKSYEFLSTLIQYGDGSPAKLEILRDISHHKRIEDELKRISNRYSRLAETMNEGLGVADANLICTFVNRKLCDLLGYEKEELVGRPIGDYIGSDDLQDFREAWDKGDSRPQEVVLSRKDGTKLIAYVASNALFDADGKFEGAFGIVSDITSLRKSDEALQESEKRLRLLSVQLMRAQEEERGRVSRELHDGLGQALSVLKLRIGFLRKQLGANQISLQEDCEDTILYLNQVIEDTRRLSRDLSPSALDDLGLAAALRRLVNQFMKLNPCHVRSQIGDIDGVLSKDAEIHLFRIFQEALTNVERHAQAQNVQVSAERQNGSIVCRIEDDGRGFDLKQLAVNSENRGLGLTIMRERVRMLGATIDLTSSIGGGTCIRFSLPVMTAGGQE
jgi:PAS domain S-box-containing protein